MHSELLANQGFGAQGFNTPPSERRVESRYDFRCQWVCPSTLKALLSFGIFPVFIANTF